MIRIEKNKNAWELFNSTNLGYNVRVVFETADCKVLRVEDNSGEGTMTMYSVFDGIYLMFNDFHMKGCYSGFSCDKSMLCIDHCRQGRIEHHIDKDKLYYMEVGDMWFDRRVHHVGQMNFPLSHYHGLTVGFQLDKAERALKEAMPYISLDLKKLSEKLCVGNYPVILKKDETAERIFSELYNAPFEIRTDYFRLKITELLLHLGTISVEEKDREKPYFYSSQIEKVKAIHDFITSDLAKSHTLEELSDKYGLTLSALKSCFKAVYGKPVYSYMKEYRMNYAASVMVQDKHIKIQEIATLVGYDNASKFSAAFRAVMGITPVEYRKNQDRSVYIE